MKIFLKISILPTPSPQFDIYDSIVSPVNISASIHHSLKRKSPLKSSQNNLDFEGSNAVKTCITQLTTLNTASSLRSRRFFGEDLRAGKLGLENCARAEKKRYVHPVYRHRTSDGDDP